MRSLIRKEFRLAYRDKIIVLLSVLIWSLFILSSALSAYQYHTDQESRAAANRKFRQQWEGQHHSPHEAAHYGSYIFKPLNLLSAFDAGLNDYFGTTYRIEAHVQHEVDYSNAESNDSLMRFGNFTLALILQQLVPLLILFTASSAITLEKESGTFKMLMAQGLKPVRLIWSKVWANYLMVALLVLPIFIVLFLMVLFSSSGGILWARFLVIMMSYLLYYLLVTMLAVMVSAWSQSSKTAVLVILTIWLLSSIILPKTAANIADQRYPLMSRATFNERVKQGYLKGINSNDPYYERVDKYLEKLKKQYHVDDDRKMPVDAAGMVMQYNEDYQNMVFNHYYHQLEKTFDQQQSFLTNSGLIDPFISLKRVSMAMSGTDFYHHNNFFQQAQQYRNDLIRQLNMELASHPEKGHVVSQDFFRQINDFKYQLPSLTNLWRLQWKSLLALCTWILILTAILQFFTKRLLL